MKRLLSLFCKAGGADMGYHMAGYEVTGIDIEQQPRYPFDFYQMDVMSITDDDAKSIREKYDAVAASPPCQGYSRTNTLTTHDYPRLINPTRDLLEKIGLPYIIENVEPCDDLKNPVRVCGSGLGLHVRRHRLFESNINITGVECQHDWQERHKPYLAITNGPGSERYTGIVSIYGRGDGTHINNLRQIEIWRVAMGIDWMNTLELAEAIPPVYTFHLGKQLIQTDDSKARSGIPRT